MYDPIKQLIKWLKREKAPKYATGSWSVPEKLPVIPEVKRTHKSLNYDPQSCRSQGRGVITPDGWMSKMDVRLLMLMGAKLPKMRMWRRTQARTA